MTRRRNLSATGGTSGPRRLRARLALALAAPVLAACAAGAPVSQEVTVSGARFEAVQGEADLVVRTVRADGSEVAGAACAVESSLYSTRLITPARLVVPNFGPQSPRLNFDCAAGDLAGTATRTVVTQWRGGYPYGGYYGPRHRRYGYGYFGPWLLSEPSWPVSRYPNVTVTLQ